MDLTQLANLGEFIGGIAVLATLIYLAVQVRQSAKITRADMAFQVVAQFNHMHDAVLANPEVVSVLLKVEFEEELTPIEARTFRSYASRLMNTWNGLAMAYEEGALSELMITQMNDDVISTCDQYPPLREMLDRMFRNSPRLGRLPIYRRFLGERGEA